jgi:hypothetical protein
MQRGKQCIASSESLIVMHVLLNPWYKYIKSVIVKAAQPKAAQHEKNEVICPATVQ